MRGLSISVIFSKYIVVHSHSGQASYLFKLDESDNYNRFEVGRDLFLVGT